MAQKQKILVVDDENDVEQLIRQKFRREIRAGELEFVFAPDGVAALETLTEHPDVDIVFSDINMPRMDGLTLLTRIGETSPLLKTVIISAYGDMENIRLAMNRGAFDFICKPFDFEDFERTLEKARRAVEQTKTTVQAVSENNILKMYVDERVLQFMCCKAYENALTDTETIEASILFTDIVGFTAISEREPPRLVVDLLNQCFDVMVKAIIAEDGIVDKFIGDAILAVFRGENHLQRAIRAALAVNRNIGEVQTRLSDGSLCSPRVSIGVNSGEVISGNVGSATLRRFDFTVIGDTVNTAQRLQNAAAAGQILITREVFEKIGSRFECREIGEIALKNKAGKVSVFEVIK